MNDELVERLAAVLHRSAQVRGSLRELPFWKDDARSVLAEIEAAGYELRPVLWEPSAEQVIAYIRAHPEAIAENLTRNNALYRSLSASRKG